MVSRFRNRRDAGRRLAAELRTYANRSDVIVLALPRRGVPVGYEVATALDVPLDVFVVRKLGLPWHEELAMGALASGGVRILDDDLIRVARVSAEDIERVTAAEQIELERRERRYRGDRPFPDLTGKTVLLVVTDWRRVRPCAPQWPRSGTKCHAVLSWQFPSRPRTPAMHFVTSLTTSCAL